MKKRGYNMSLLKEVVDILANGEQLPEKYLDHPLSGDYKGVKRMSYRTGLAFDL